MQRTVPQAPEVQQQVEQQQQGVRRVRRQGVEQRLQVVQLQQGEQQAPLRLRPLICLGEVVAVLLLVVPVAQQQGVRGVRWTSCVATRSSSC
jgi:hypothetical protein